MEKTNYFVNFVNSKMDKLIDTKKARDFLKLLMESERIVMTCHVRPDGDAIGSTLGLWHLLRTLGKEATVVVPDKAPPSLSFLPGFKEIGVYTVHKEFCEKTIGESDLIICCDFNIPSRQDNLAPVVQNARCRKVLIDHHTEPSDFTDLVFSYPRMSSTCELVFRIIAAMGLYEHVDRDCATCLLTGIITDTRNFTVNVKYPDIYDILMRLLEKDVDKDRIIKEALNTRSLNSLKLEAYALSQKMEIFPDHRCALITLDKDELKEFSYEKGDTEGLVNKPLEVKGMVYSIFLREDPDCVKISGRSCDDFPVSEICKELYGGGGHLQAAGAEFYGPLEECRKILVDNMNRFDKYLK
ncbi:MAG: bifunctional oligoribonuclease/PAP phosphatase NrnA [Muribaculaceae bacterium]|nr:bifunctional oligoribonuclease/PAP phosphatase NrnA [Muribaculaceae bacterium]